MGLPCRAGQTQLPALVECPVGRNTNEIFSLRVKHSPFTDIRSGIDSVVVSLAIRPAALRSKAGNRLEPAGETDCGADPRASSIAGRREGACHQGTGVTNPATAGGA